MVPLVIKHSNVHKRKHTHTNTQLNRNNVRCEYSGHKDIAYFRNAQHNINYRETKIHFRNIGFPIQMWNCRLAVQTLVNSWLMVYGYRFFGKMQMVNKNSLFTVRTVVTVPFYTVQTISTIIII